MNPSVNQSNMYVKTPDDQKQFEEVKFDIKLNKACTESKKRHQDSNFNEKVGGLF